MGDRRPEEITILVVEDYEDTSLAMRLALEEQGYRILEASDGAQAVEVAARERPGVILMDLTLPVVDGFDATRRIRQNPELRDTIVIAVTAHQEPDFRSKAMEAGCTAYVTKPIDFDWLDDLINSLIS